MTDLEPYIAAMRQTVDDLVDATDDRRTREILRAAIDANREARAHHDSMMLRIQTEVNRRAAAYAGAWYQVVALADGARTVQGTPPTQGDPVAKPEPLPAHALRLDHHVDPIAVDEHGHPLGHVTATTHADGDTLTDAATQLLHRMPAPLYRALRHAMETIDR